MSPTTTKAFICFLLNFGLLALISDDGLMAASISNGGGDVQTAGRDGEAFRSRDRDNDRDALDGFQPGTRQEAELYQMLLQLQRELAEIRQELRELGPPREGSEARDVDRSRNDQERLRDGNVPRDGSRPRQGNTLHDSDFLLPSAIDADPVLAQQFASDLPQAAMRAMKKAASFYRDDVASHGGYVYYYSLDLQQRWGEGKPSADTIFVQPPGTPGESLSDRGRTLAEIRRPRSNRSASAARPDGTPYADPPGGSGRRALRRHGRFLRLSFGFEVDDRGGDPRA